MTNPSSGEAPMRVRIGRSRPTPYSGSYVSLIDLFSGVGGFSLGAREAGFTRVAGLEMDPFAADVYRRHVGPCWLGDIRTDGHPPFQAPVVFADLPIVDSSWKLSLPQAHATGEATHALRIAREAAAEIVLLSWPCQGRGREPKFTRFGRFPDVQWIEGLCQAAGYSHTSTTVINYAEYGTPHERKRYVSAAFSHLQMFNRFKWPQATHGTKNRPPLVTVEDVLGIPYPFPAPPITTSERKSSWKGVNGGKAKPRRASEIIATYVGRAAWGTTPVALPNAALAKLQGLPSDWGWELMSRDRASLLIGRAFAPSVARSLCVEIFRLVQFRRKLLTRRGIL